MELTPLLLLAHAGLTSLLLLVLGAIVLGQHVSAVVRTRARRHAAVGSAHVPAPREAPETGASVLEWTVDLRGVGQREAALRT